MNRSKRRINRHAFLRDLPQGVWCPAAVGRVPGYPKTEAVFEAQKARCNANRDHALANGTLTRLGVPNGYAGRKDEIAEIRRNSQTEAERLCDRVFVPDCWEARVAMETAMQIMLCALNPMRARLQALRTVLEYTVPKPVANSVPRRLTDGLEFLMQLAKVARQD